MDRIKILHGSLRWNEKSFNAQHAAYIRRKNVRLADKLHISTLDIIDSVQAKVLREEKDLPKNLRKSAGQHIEGGSNTMVLDIVKHSENLNDIMMSKEVKKMQ